MIADPVDDLARAIYSQSPAVSPFTRKPIPYETARELGINSWVCAHIAAVNHVEEGTPHA